MVAIHCVASYNNQRTKNNGLITRGLLLIKKGDASPFKTFKSSNLKYAKS